MHKPNMTDLKSQSQENFQIEEQRDLIPRTLLVIARVLLRKYLN